MPIVGGDFEERALAAALDHQALNQAAASLYRERFDSTPGIVYAAGVDHAYNLAQEFRAAGLKAEAVSGRTPPVKLAETLAAYERGDINVLINAMLLAEAGTRRARRSACTSRRRLEARLPAADRPDHADAPAQGGRHRRRLHARSRPRTTTASSRSTRCSTPTSTARARASRPAPRRRVQRRARRRLSPAPWLVPVTADVARRLAVIQREWQRIDPKFLDEDEQRYWATIAGRQIRFDQRAEFAKKFAEARASKPALETFLSVCAAENPNRRLRMTALQDRVSMTVERADFDDLVTLVAQAPPWEKDRAAGVRILLRAIGEGKANAPTRSCSAGRGSSRRRRGRCRTAARAPSSRRRSGCSAPSPTRAATGTRRTCRS